MKCVHFPLTLTFVPLVHSSIMQGDFHPARSHKYVDRLKMLVEGPRAKQLHIFSLPVNTVQATIFLEGLELIDRTLLNRVESIKVFLGAGMHLIVLRLSNYALVLLIQAG